MTGILIQLGKIIISQNESGVNRIRQKFIDHNFSKKSQDRISKIQEILNEYDKQGLTLTLRQLYYQLVSRDIIPNKQTEYHKISDLVSNARRAGLVDWDIIEDRTRYLRGYRHYDNPADCIRSAAYGYAIDLQADQAVYLEVWVEKDALVDLVGRACNKYDIPFFSCRGFTSDSEIYKAGRRMRRRHESDRDIVVLHLGDHDPSGLDMSRDILERLELFGEIPGLIDFRRIALNRDQIEKFNPPPNPAKETDTRFKKYLEEYGSTSWELDALEPSVLMNLIEQNITSILDMDKFRAREKLEDQQRNEMIEIASGWT